MQRQSQKSKKVSCGTVDNVPILVRIKEKVWKDKKQEVLKYCINLLDPNQNSNLIILCEDYFSSSTDIDSIMDRITNRNIIYAHDFMTMSSEFNNYEEKKFEIIITSDKNFVGCNLTRYEEVENIKGIKEDNTFY